MQKSKLLLGSINATKLIDELKKGNKPKNQIYKFIDKDGDEWEEMKRIKILD